MLAHEYYDAARHPTCANFRHASRIFIREALERVEWPSVSLLELGAGKSVAAELVLDKYRERLGLLSITDASPEMLSYSRPWAGRGARLQIADALALPYRSDTYSLVVASLADPYNEAALWTEATRVLCRGGQFVVTLPAYEWALRFRNQTGCPADRAEFVLRDGTVLLVPSFVFSKDDIAIRGQHAGLTLQTYRTVYAEELLQDFLSPKLQSAGSARVPVIDGYVFVKH